jgi:transcription-repair coupling factor (superfamily II helicase)
MRDMADELLRLYANENSSAVTPSPPTRRGSRSLKTAFLCAHARSGNRYRRCEEGHGRTVADGPVCCAADVGYGKTEVAMRAAFKSVMEGKQAAILTPTTSARLSTPTTRFAIALLHFR